jgi:beta-glucanase (GH16 family)
VRSFGTFPVGGTLLGFVLLASLIGAVQPTAAQCVDLQGCALVWSDEFDGTEVDLSKWTFQLGDGSEVGLPSGWGNNELQYYRAENATVSGGYLIVTAKEESFGGLDYTSTRMRSLDKGDWTFGRMEVRARMPIGQGLWPAFWMLPSDSSIYGTWAASGEIDIVEYLGSEPERVLGTIHYGGSYPANVWSSSDYILSSGTFNDDFHVFAVEWEHGEIRWYVDGIRYATRTNWYSTGGPFPAPFDIDFHLLLNLAVGGNLPGPPDATTVFPQEYVIDYVRVYQVTNETPEVVITSPTADDVITPGDDLTITLSVIDDGSIELVQFLQDSAILGETTVPPFELTVPAVAAGCYSLTARARDDIGVVGTSEPLEIMVGADCRQAPYRMTPADIPGTIEVEDYDLGGPGIAYNDFDASNNGGAYRPAEGVDLEATADTGHGFNLGWVEPGEWIEYTVDVFPGTYDFQLRVASELTGGTFHIEVDGIDKTGPVTFARTFGWQNWITVNVEDVTFGGGVQTLRLVFETGSFNVNKIIIPAPMPGPVGAVPNGGDVPGIPLTVGAGSNGDLVLDWGASCLSTDGDYVVYEGLLGDLGSHSPVTCSTGGLTNLTLTPGAGDRYYLVSPTDGVSEGSHGTDSNDSQRLPGTVTCFPLDVGECP